MKNRMSSMDVRAQVGCLQPLLGLRLANIYDLNSKTFIFKLRASEKKSALLIESGIRFHTTEFTRDKSAAPSPMNSKVFYI